MPGCTAADLSLPTVLRDVVLACLADLGERRGGPRRRAMTRNPAGYTGIRVPVHGDVHDPGTLGTAIARWEAAYCLVHSLGDADFERTDAAATFGPAGARAGLQQIIYLGGIGDDQDAFSTHLRSRREVERLLGSYGVPVTVIRAGSLSATAASSGS